MGLLDRQNVGADIEGNGGTACRCQMGNIPSSHLQQGIVIQPSILSCKENAPIIEASPATWIGWLLGPLPLDRDFPPLWAARSPKVEIEFKCSSISAAGKLPRRWEAARDRLGKPLLEGQLDIGGDPPPGNGPRLTAASLLGWCHHQVDVRAHPFGGSA